MKSFLKEQDLLEGASLEFEFESEQLTITPKGQPGWTVEFTPPEPQPVWLLQSVIINSNVYYMFVGEQSFS